MSMFLSFLVHRGVVTGSELEEAKEKHHRSGIPLDQLAAAENLLTTAELDSIAVEQCRAHERFVDTAVRLGLLSRADVARLLSRQNQSRPSMETILVEMGAIGAAELEGERLAYRDHFRIRQMAEEEAYILSSNGLHLS